MIPGYYILDAVLDRLRAEAKKTIITAAAPRVTVNHIPISGGYGITLPADDIPENWGAGRLVATPTPRDELCPFISLDKWLSMDSGSSIGDDELAPFTLEELSDDRDEDADELLNGAGLITVDVFMPPGPPELRGAGVEANIAPLVSIICQIIVPAGRGRKQGALYSSLLARMLTDAVIPVEDATNAALDFGWTPEVAPLGESGDAWLIFPWEAQAALQYNLPKPLRP